MRAQDSPQTLAGNHCLVNICSGSGGSVKVAEAVTGPADPGRTGMSGFGVEAAEARTSAEVSFWTHKRHSYWAALCYPGSILRSEAECSGSWQ
jgi:hypothetical protein